MAELDDLKAASQNIQDALVGLISAADAEKAKLDALLAQGDDSVLRAGVEEIVTSLNAAAETAKAATTRDTPA